METSSRSDSSALVSGSDPATDTPRISLTLFGRSGTGRIDGTINRLESARTRGIVSGPAAWMALLVIAALVMLVGQSILSGGSAASTAVLIAGCTLVAVVVVAGDQLWGARRTASIADEFAATHIIRGTLVGDGKVRDAANRALGLAPVLSLYANDDKVLVVVEGRDGQRTSFDVDSLDLEAAASGRYVDCSFSVDGVDYGLRSVHGRLSTDPGRYQ